MKEIELSQNLVTVVDDSDYEYLIQWKWYAHQGRSTYYARNNGIGFMHRLILELTNTSIGVDHIDGNGWNNQRYNIRKASNGQNLQNREAQANNTSGYKGVTWHTGSRRWMSQIRSDEKIYCLGYFISPIDAAMAYDEAAIYFHGEFANLNFKK